MQQLIDEHKQSILKNFDYKEEDIYNELEIQCKAASKFINLFTRLSNRQELSIVERDRNQGNEQIYPFILQQRQRSFIVSYVFILQQIHLGPSKEHKKVQEIEKVFKNMEMNYKKIEILESLQKTYFLRKQSLAVTSNLTSLVKKEEIIEEVIQAQSSMDPFQNVKKYRRNNEIIKRIRKTQQQKSEDLREGVDPKATKNIPKNYAKAIITYILKNQAILKPFFNNQSSENDFLEYLKKKKFTIQNIKQFSYMLSNSVEDPNQRVRNMVFRKITQTLFQLIMLKAITYIFNSRIVQEAWHIKYRNDILNAVRQPERFTKVKIKQ